MNQMSRLTAFKIAAILSLIVALIGIFGYDLPNLMLGAAASEDPYWLVIGSFVSDILVFAGAYGAWRGKKWGAVLLILINAYWLIQATSTLFMGSTTFDFVFSSVMLIHHVVVIALCLWREPVTA